MVRALEALPNVSNTVGHARRRGRGRVDGGGRRLGVTLGPKGASVRDRVEAVEAALPCQFRHQHDDDAASVASGEQRGRRLATGAHASGPLEGALGVRAENARRLIVGCVS